MHIPRSCRKTVENTFSNPHCRTGRSDGANAKRVRRNRQKVLVPENTPEQRWSVKNPTSTLREHKCAFQAAVKTLRKIPLSIRVAAPVVVMELASSEIDQIIKKGLVPEDTPVPWWSVENPPCTVNEPKHEFHAAVETRQEVPPAIRKATPAIVM